MRVLVCGGRNYIDWRHIFLVLSKLHTSRGPFTLVMHGNAAGADTAASAWAQKMGIPERRFPADWRAHGGRMAGPIRNQQMIDEGHEHGCECKTCRPDLWEPHEADWGKLTEAVRHAAFDHQIETRNRNEIWGNYQLAEGRYTATAKRLDEALKALAAAVKQLEKDGEEK